MKLSKILFCAFLMMLLCMNSAFAAGDEAVLIHNGNTGSSYATIEAALADAVEGDTIRLLKDADVEVEKYETTNAKYFPNNNADHCTVDLNGHTLTILNKNGDALDDFCFRSTTFKNGTLKLDAGLKASTAIFWIMDNQTLTFDNVKLVATGVSGIYLFGFQGTSSKLKFINGAELIIDNSAMIDLTIIADNGSQNEVLFDDADVTMKNAAKFAQNTSLTIQNGSNISLKNIERGIDLADSNRRQTFVIDNSTVTIDGASKSPVRMANDTGNIQNGGKLTIKNTKNNIAGIVQGGNAQSTINVSADSTYTNDAGEENGIQVNITRPTATPTAAPTATPTAAPTAAPTATPVADTSAMPKTGDTSRLALWFALLAISCAGGVMLMKKSARGNRQ